MNDLYGNPVKKGDLILTSFQGISFGVILSTEVVKYQNADIDRATVAIFYPEVMRKVTVSSAYMIKVTKLPAPAKAALKKRKEAFLQIPKHVYN